MSSKEWNPSALIRNIKINRFLYIAITFNLLAFTAFFFCTGRISSAISTLWGWGILVAYMTASEVILKIAQNSTLITEETADKLFNVNTAITSIFLLVISFISGNKDYLFLCIIPIFQSALERKTTLVSTIVGISSAAVLAAELKGWFFSPFLVVNQAPIMTKSLSFLTVFGVLTALGYVLAKTMTFTQGKVNYLHSIATTDALTGLLNRRKFNQRLSEEFARSKRHKSTLSLALFDIDFFKKINDTYGHPAGDAILKELGKLISSNIRACDVAARYGGEEFALILPETSQTMAHELMDRIRTLVESEVFNKTSQPIRATISIGVAQLDLTDATPLEFCERTDKALYKAKKEGRNRVESAPYGVPQFSYKVSSAG